MLTFFNFYLHQKIFQEFYIHNTIESTFTTSHRKNILWTHIVIYLTRLHSRQKSHVFSLLLLNVYTLKQHRYTSQTCRLKHCNIHYLINDFYTSTMLVTFTSSTTPYQYIYIHLNYQTSLILSLTLSASATFTVSVSVKYTV